jgi:hypothetical protein
MLWGHVLVVCGGGGEMRGQVCACFASREGFPGAQRMAVDYGVHSAESARSCDVTRDHHVIHHLVLVPSQPTPQATLRDFLEPWVNSHYLSLTTNALPQTTTSETLGVL